MKAKILSATEGNTYTRKDGTIGTIYQAVCDNGKVYSCFSKRVMEKIGQEVEFEEVVRDYQGKPQYTMNLPKEGGGQGFKKWGGGGKSNQEIALGGKTMLLSYVKDVVVAGIEKGLILQIDAAFSEIKVGFETLLPLLDLDSISKVQEPVKQETLRADVEPTIEDPAKPAQIEIIKQKMKGKNFRATDLADFAGAMCSVELKYDASTDDIVWGQVTQAEANSIINSMG
jgi:hypothetical protein